MVFFLNKIAIDFILVIILLQYALFIIPDQKLIFIIILLLMNLMELLTFFSKILIKCLILRIISFGLFIFEHFHYCSSSIILFLLHTKHSHLSIIYKS